MSVMGSSNNYFRVSPQVHTTVFTHTVSLLLPVPLLRAIPAMMHGFAVYQSEWPYSPQISEIKLDNFSSTLAMMERGIINHVFRGWVNSYAKIVAASDTAPFSLVSFLRFTLDPGHEDVEPSLSNSTSASAKSV